MRTALTMALLLSACPALAGYGGDGPSAEESVWIREHVGMYTWGRLHEKELVGCSVDVLSDMADRLGASIVRTAVVMRPERWRWDWDPDAGSFVDVVSRPEYRWILRQHPTVVLTLADHSGRCFEPDWTREHYQALTEYLLRAHPDSEKTFILGIWEGDHWLTEASMAGHPEQVETYRRYFQARHEGILAGRAAVPGAKSRVIEMIEMVSLDYGGEKFLVNRVVPQTSADLYSLSSWGYSFEIPKAFDYIKTKAPDSDAYGKRNVMVGEAGGPSNLMPPALRLQENRRILAGARAWGAPYVIWWSLAGTAGDNSLQRPAWEGSAKLTPWYWFHRAYHAADDPLVVEDFNEDPHGPAGGDFDEAGYALNRLGGRRELSSGAFASVSPRGPGRRGLDLRFRPGGGRWSTGLMHLDARRFGSLRLRWQGTAKAVLALTDAGGHTARAALTGGLESVPLARLKGVALADLSSVAVEAAGALRVDEVAFVGGGKHPAEALPGAADSPRAAQIPLNAARQPLPVPAPAAAKVGFVRVRPAAAIHAPKLNDVPLADELLPGQELTIRAGGSGHLRFGPLASLLDVKHPEQVGLTSHGLIGFPEYHSLQPDQAADEHWLEWHWSAPWPVRWFRLTLYGSQRTGTKATAAMRYSLDQKTWHEALVDPREWDETNWVARPPADFQPSRELWLRFALLPDRTLADWPWTVGITDLRVDLTLDAGRCVLPPFAGLEYRDNGPADAYRGLLDLDG